MELLNERELESGDYEWDIDYTEEEFAIFKKYAKDNKEDFDDMSEEDIVQFAIVGILTDQLEIPDEERKDNEQD